jgi:hypothetical protein
VANRKFDGFLHLSPELIAQRETVINGEKDNSARYDHRQLDSVELRNRGDA